MTEKRLFDYLFDQLAENPLQQAFGQRVNGAWKYYSTAEMVEMANHIALGLLEMGLKPGEKVATVVYKTTPEWIALDHAMLQIGVLNIPLYPTISSREYQYILNESETTFCFVGDGDLYTKVAAAKQNTASLKRIYAFQQHPECADQLSQIIEAGRNSTRQAELEQRRQQVKPDDIATIIYTSGTTGNPKGVVLTHGNIVFNVEAMRKLLPISAGDRVLSFLPVSHIFERAAVYAFCAYGASVSFTTTDNLGGDEGDIKAIKPHFFTAVPRLLEKVYDKIYAKGLALTGAKKALFFWALGLAEHWEFDYQPSGWTAFKWKIADKLIFSKWREALGGEIKGIVTGASACPVRIMRTFNAAGIPVREGYGMTEAAPAFTFCRFVKGGAKLGTVGLPLEGVTLRIDSTGGDYKPGEGEILGLSPGVMVGYYLQPDKTAEMIREIDGQRWLATGDVGTLITEPDGRQFLKITDRKKELLKTSGGKYVAPAPIESTFKEHHLVEQIMVVGENLKFVSALIIPSADGLRDWCQKHSVPFNSMAEAIKDERVVKRYQMLLDRINPSLGHVEQVKKFTLLSTTWDMIKTDGTEAELTPSLKLKRRVIMQKYKPEIDAMYE